MLVFKQKYFIKWIFFLNETCQMIINDRRWVLNLNEMCKDSREMVFCATKWLGKSEILRGMCAAWKESSCPDVQLRAANVKTGPLQVVVCLGANTGKRHGRLAGRRWPLKLMMLNIGIHQVWITCVYCRLASVGDAGSIPGSGESPGGGHGCPLQYYHLENSMDKGAL